METLKLAIMAVIRSMGHSIDEGDFVKYFSYTRNWISPAKARKLFRTCVDANLLKREGDKYVPTFETTGVIPLDFKITDDIVDRYSVRDDVFTVMLDRICNEKNINRKEALMAINRIKKEARYINTEVATLIYCRIEGVNCEDFYDTVEKRLVI